MMSNKWPHTTDASELGLEFRAEDHTYTLNGRPVPSVTTVLEPYSGLEHVDPEVLAAAAEFGTHVHEACHLFNIGALDRASLTPLVDQYLLGWEKFLDDSGAAVVYSERKVVHAQLRYAGTLDTILLMRRARHNLLYDIKTGTAIPKTVGPQTAAYNEAWHYMTGQRRMRRYCVLLKPNDYNVVDLDKQKDGGSHYDIFKAALQLHRWQNGE